MWPKCGVNPTETASLHMFPGSRIFFPEPGFFALSQSDRSRYMHVSKAPARELA
jgi:hypothetical protein